MERRKIIGLIILMATVLFYGCSKSDDGGSPTDPIDPPADPTIPAGDEYCKYMPDEVVLSSNETLYQLYVESNISPEKFSINIEAEGEQWCQAKITQDQNAENSLVIEITSDTYNSEDGLGQPLYEPYRTATLHVTYGSIVNKRIKIVQEGYIMLLTEIDYTSASVLKVSPKGETTEVKVLTNCYSWMCFTNDDWVTVTKKDDATFVVTSSPRPEGQTEMRQAEITVMSNKFINGLSPTMVKIQVIDADAGISGDDYDYDDNVTEWD
jgi:hypothetical protein